MPDKNRIIIVLGSNEGAERNMDLACRKLEELFPVQWSEAVYTQPLRCAVRKPFLNRVGLSFTSWGIKELRECFKRIEKELGRTAESKQIGIIPMDIDLILWNDSLLKPDDWTRDYVQDGLRQLAFCRQFYRIYPIANALRSQLNWTQYRMLIQIDDPDKRMYYELESVNNGWTARETERQINSHLYERLLLSNDKEAVLAVARKERIPQSPLEIIKDPMYLEFLGLERKAAYYEKDLESAIITRLQHFLLELGQGFTFVARQKRILLEDDEFFADLVFYNRLLKCFVVIELKTGKLTHQDLGQLQMYVNYYDRVEKTAEENPTIGILLCTSKNDTAVRMALPEDNKTILASEYKLYLPTQAQLIDEVNSVRKMVEGQHGFNKGNEMEDKV